MADVSMSTSTHHIPGRKKKTLALFCSFLGLGLAASVYGPTMVSMEYILETDTKTISFGFSGNALGYLAGAVFCGFVYAPINKELLFTLALHGIALATILTPFSFDVVFFVVAYAVQGFFMAVIDTAGQSYALKLWAGSKLKDPIMQGAHFIWSVGSTAGPFMLRHFLVDIDELQDIPRNATNITDINATVDDAPPININFTLENGWNYTSQGNVTELEVLQKEQMKRVFVVVVGFGLVALTVFACAIFFCCVFCCHGVSCRDRHAHDFHKKRKLTLPKSYHSFRLTLLVFMFLFYFTYLWLEAIPGAFIAVFVVKGLGWPNKYGAVITAAYWCSHGCGRLIGIPLTTCMTPRNMLIADLTLLSIGFGVMIFIPFYEVLVWVGIIIAGLGMGTIFASGILWLEEFMEITGAASSVLLAAASLGGILGPLLTGYLFDEVGHMCVVHIVFTACLVEIIIFTAVNFYAENHSSRPKVWRSYTLEVADPPLEIEIQGTSATELGPLTNREGSSGSPSSHTDDVTQPLNARNANNAELSDEVRSANSDIGDTGNAGEARTIGSCNIEDDIEFITPPAENESTSN